MAQEKPSRHAISAKKAWHPPCNQVIPPVPDPFRACIANREREDARLEALISWSIRNRVLVLVAAAGLCVWGWFAMQRTPVDALPDLSENQVIVFTEWMGRSPQIMEDQVTFPLVSNLQGIPKVKSVRAVSMFGMSFIYVVFQDDAETYWARTRVLERLAYAQRGLPAGVVPTLGPDGTGVGHVFWYTLEGPGYDLGELRALQDWYVKFALQTVDGVSEVASFGGFEKQYQVALDPRRMAYHRVTLDQLMAAIAANNGAAGGASYQTGGMSYVVRGLGYLKSIRDIEAIAVSGHGDAPVRVKDVADVREAGNIRLGIAEENGRGEVAGGIVVMRYGENAKDVIARVKERLRTVQQGLPKGVRFKTAYDRSDLILAAIGTLRESLLEEIAVVSLVMLIFLFHVRSALVVILTIPFSVLIGAFGVSSNIMSLGGIALAIGDLVDSGIVMVEGAYRKLSEGEGSGHGGEAA
jgi:Cu(I)/Ag(I) efflux system membrane protein CusA/SilA